MNSTREQRRNFVKNAKKQWKLGLISKSEYEQLKSDISRMGIEQHENLQQTISENKKGNLNDNSIDIDAELVEEDFTPDDI